MDIQFFCTIISNLLQTHVIYLADPGHDLAVYEQTCCFHPRLQPMFTAEGLSVLTSSAKPNTFYEIEDSLHVCLMLFLFQDIVCLIGPYVKEPFNSKKMQNELSGKNISFSILHAIKLYYSGFSVLNTEQMLFLLRRVILSFSPACPEYSYRRLIGFQEEVSPSSLRQTDSRNHEIIYTRYEIENRFLKYIEQGMASDALREFDQMSRRSMPEDSFPNFVFYQQPLVSFTILRSLARKAAEHGGLSVILIDEITQTQVQKSLAARTLSDHVTSLREMIQALADGVRQAKLRTCNCSAETAKILEYLSLHYTEEIHIEDLVRLTHFSKAHISSAFKKEVHMSIFQYIARLRCEQAAELLKDTRLSIQDVGSYVGYDDNNYFVKVFKRQYGVTPSAFRNQHL